MEPEFLFILERRPSLRDELGVVWAGHGRVELHEPLPRRLLVGLQFFVCSDERGESLFSLDPQAFRSVRRRMLLERRSERVAADRLVLLELAGRHEQVRPDRVEGQGTRVGGQVAHVDFDTEQIVKRAFVLPTVEPPHGDPAPLVGQHLPGRHHRGRQVVEKVGLRCPLRLPFVLRRHIAGVEHVEYLLPSLRGGDGVDYQRQVVDPHARFLGVGSVAPLTVRLEQLPMPHIDRRLRGSRSARPGSGPARHDDGTTNQQLHAHRVSLDPLIIDAIRHR